MDDLNRPARLLAGLAIAFALAPAAALAKLVAIELPADAPMLRPSELPGYRLALQKCGICHSADYVSYQPPGMTLKQWTAETAKMAHTYGAPLGETDIRQIGAYLAVAYGSAKAKDVDVLAASSVPSPATPSAVNVQALLNANACLGCHGVKQKIVGPGYGDVARKYRGDAQALAKVAASIGGGSTGKWGAVAMPPYNTLKPDEIKALAEFVLAQ